MISSRLHGAIEGLAGQWGRVVVFDQAGAGCGVRGEVGPRPVTLAARCKLFGRAFDASMSAAELARATGWLLPVYLPRTSRGYSAQILPAIAYDRQEIGSREGRVALTQKIMQAFEPAIRLYVNQWFHFVPIGPQ